MGMDMFIKTKNNKVSFDKAGYTVLDFLEKRLNTRLERNFTVYRLHKNDCRAINEFMKQYVQQETQYKNIYCYAIRNMNKLLEETKGNTKIELYIWE